MKTELQKTATAHLENLKTDWSSHKKYYKFCKHPEVANKLQELLASYYGNQKLYTLSTPDNIYSYPVYATDDWFIAKPLNDIELSFTSEADLPEKPNPNAISHAVKSHLYEQNDSPEDLPEDVAPYLEDQRTYCFTEFDPRRHSFTVTETKAFTTLSYSQRIYTEIFNALYKSRSSDDITSEAFQKMSYRDNVLQNPQQIVDMSLHPRQIILSTLVVVEGDNGLTTIISHPKDQYTYSEWLTTVPTGRFQPTASSEDESDLTHAVLKQFGQKLYSYNSFSKGQYRHTALDDLTDLLIGDEASLYYTGAGVNLIDGTPFITTLLYIEDDGFLDQYVYEPPEGQEQLKEVQLTEENISQMLQNAKIRPESAVALYKGASYIDKNYQSIFSG